MQINERFDLGRTQHELDFVDIDTDVDTPLFVDPYFLAHRKDAWSTSAHRTVRNFYETAIRLIIEEEIVLARAMFRHLQEPNETCLGLSRARPQGRGVGVEQADAIFDAILESGAIQTGVVEDLEDFRLFVKGIGRDKISDMTTNIIRKHLIEYTQSQCELWDIPMRQGTASGLYWDRVEGRWNQQLTDMLVIEEDRILLVPKSAVSLAKDYSDYQYHQHFVLNFLQDEHLRLGTRFVKERRLADGRIKRSVPKSDLKEDEAPLDKAFLLEFTERHPEVFRRFREEQRSRLVSLDSLRIAEATAEFQSAAAWGQRYEQLQPEAVAQHLLNELAAIEPGNADAERFHKLSVAILEFILYPNLVCPQKEQEIHQGRKRIDISFDNAATSGFFHRVHATMNIPAQFIFAECKNYSADPANPELDQLIGRLSPNRGKVGVLMARRVEDLDLLIQRCADAYVDQHGLLLPLMDADIQGVLNEVIETLENPIDDVLSTRARRVILH